MSQEQFWSSRYRDAGDQYLFGLEPNHYLESHRDLILNTGKSAMLIADGEGRNSVWLAEQGMSVVACDISHVAIEKARKLSSARKAVLDFICADILASEFQLIHAVQQFDWVIGIFIQFTDAQLRIKQFELMKRLTQPGGRVLLQGYTPQQLEYRTGGPSAIENLYTKEILESAFCDWEIEEIVEYEALVAEGLGHQGISALIGMIARKPSD